MDNRFIHMVPLLLFTSMATVAAGLMTGLTLLTVMGFKSPQYGRYLLLTFVLIGFGTLISLLHLGRKERFLRALLGINHSWLSREVLVAGIFVALAGGNFILFKLLPPSDYPSLLSTIITVAAVLSAIFLTWTIGLVYNLPSRSTWGGFPNYAGPFVTAYLIGSYIFFLLGNFSRSNWLVFIPWAVDFSLVLWRFITFQKLIAQKLRFVFPHLISLSQTAHFLRLFLSLGLFGSFFVSVNASVLFILFSAPLLDRLCLYASTVQLTPKSEISVLKSERMREAVAQCSLKD